MPEILFIDVQDKSGLNPNVIRRHAAEVAHRKKRMTNVFRHQNQVARQKPLSIRLSAHPRQPEQADTTEEDETEDQLRTAQDAPPDRKAHQPPARKTRQVRDSKAALMLRWRAGNPTAIKPPTDDLKIEFVLSESFNWMMGQYTSSWSPLVRRDPKVFDLNGEVEILREAFYIVSDLLEIRKTAAAFTVLKHTLDSIPAVFRDPHPELLFTLVELAYGINMAGATDLHAQIRPHVAELASTIMGKKHPLTILLKSEFDVVLQTHVTELVFKCIIDAMSKTFGRIAYQTLVQQMGRSQFYARTGRGNEGQKLIAEIQEQWKHLYGTDSAVTRLAELELCLMRLQSSANPEPALEAQANNAMLRVEIMAGVYSNKFTDKAANHSPIGDQPPLKMALAQWFLQHKRYSFALHCYGAERSRKKGEPSGVATRPLADLIADTVAVALADVLWRPGNLLIVGSQAPMSESVLATS